MLQYFDTFHLWIQADTKISELQKGRFCLERGGVFLPKKCLGNRQVKSMPSHL